MKNVNYNWQKTFEEILWAGAVLKNQFYLSNNNF